ncbi:MAG: hypothetical protein NT027_05110 [Proteobacteria bacterium]|nr:hypothetical protein [Pseudomonadota bacterium]
MMVKNSKVQTVFCAGLVAMLLNSCGKKEDKETVYVQAPQATQPVAVQPTPTPSVQKGFPTDAEKVVSALNVVVRNKDTLTSKALPKGQASIEFGLSDTSVSGVSGIVYKCKLERRSSQGTALAEACTSPKVLNLTQDGQFTFTVFAVHTETGSTGLSNSVDIAVGNAIVSNGGTAGGGSTGGGSTGGSISGGGSMQPVSMQVGDMFNVTVPEGFHMVYRSSTFDEPGRLQLQIIDGGYTVDNAAPYHYSCQVSDRRMTMMTSAGDSIKYCQARPSINFNASGDPFFNTFRWDSQNMISYNGIMISSDSSLEVSDIIGAQDPSMARMSINVFSNVNGLQNGGFNKFATELSHTSSRLGESCFGQSIQYLGNAAIMQGFFHWDIAAAPLFGCVSARNNQWYAVIGAMPIERQLSINPQMTWAGWMGQSFANTRAAEIVVEIGPFNFAPVPMSIAPDAQNIMVQNIKKLMPSANMGGGFGNGGFLPGFNH